MIYLLRCKNSPERCRTMPDGVHTRVIVLVDKIQVIFGRRVRDSNVDEYIRLIVARAVGCRVHGVVAIGRRPDVDHEGRVDSSTEQRLIQIAATRLWYH